MALHSPVGLMLKILMGIIVKEEHFFLLYNIEVDDSPWRQVYTMGTHSATMMLYAIACFGQRAF